MTLQGQVQDPEVVRENFNKIAKALKNIGGGIVLQTNDVNNSLQNKLDLIDSGNITFEYLGSGKVTAHFMGSNNIDGGYAAAIYLSSQKFDGGNA